MHCPSEVVFHGPRTVSGGPPSFWNEECVIKWFFHLLGVLFCRKAQSSCSVCSLRRNQDLPQGCTIVSWLLLPGLCIPSLPRSATALWNSGKVMEAEACSLKTRNGGHRKACVPRVASTQPLLTGAKWKHGDRVLVKEKK